MQSPPNEQVRAGQIARGAILLAKELCRTALDGVRLDKEVEQYIRDEGGEPALKGYHPAFAQKPYEWTICLGIDKDVVHGVPIKTLGSSKLITVDLVVRYKGWHADTARTFTYSDDPVKRQFADVSKVIFDHAKDSIIPNQMISLFGTTVYQGAQIQGYEVVKECCGHGRTIHTEPQVLNYPTFTPEVFQVGRSYAVEPVLAISPYKLHQHPYDGFSVLADCLVSHNEDTIFIGTNGVVNLTGNQP